MEQLRAITWVRWRMLTHSLRTGSGVLSLLGRILMAILWAVVALGMGAMVAGLIHEAFNEKEEVFVFYSFTIAFGMAVACGMILPLMMETSRASLDVSRLLIYPISARRLFLISQTAIVGSFEHLLYYPTLLAVCIFGVFLSDCPLWPGLGIVASMWIFVLAWSHTIGLFFQSIMKSRRNRELIGIITIALFVLIIYGPMLLGVANEEQNPDTDPDFEGVGRWLNGSGRILLPVMAAHALASATGGETGPVMKCLIWLWAWTLAGLLIGNVFFVRLSIGGRGRMPSVSALRRRESRAKKRVETKGSIGDSLFNFLPATVHGVASRDLRYIMRSMNGRMAFVFDPVFVAMILLV